jgi:hypothetical protein
VADAEGAFSLRVLRPAGATGITYSMVGASAVAVSRDLGRHTFSTALPIKAGDTVALNVSGPSKIGFAKTGPSGMIAIWIPPIDEGRPDGFDQASTGYEFAFNAEIQPHPTVTALSPVSGSFKGRRRGEDRRD